MDRNEEFDRRIKQQLENVEPAFNPAAWSAMSAMLDNSPMPAPTVFWKKLLPWSILALMLAGNTAFFFHTQQTQDKYTNLIAQYEQMLRHEKRYAAVIDTLTIYDTISFEQRQGGQPYMAASGHPFAPYRNPNQYNPFDQSFDNPNPTAYSYTATSSTAQNHVFLGSAYQNRPYDGRPSYGRGQQDQPVQFVFIPVAAPPQEGDYASTGGMSRAAMDRWQAFSNDTLSLLPEELKWKETNWEEGLAMHERGKAKRQRPSLRKLPLQTRVGATAGLVIPNPDLQERFLSRQFGVNAEFSFNNKIRLFTAINHRLKTYLLTDLQDQVEQQPSLRTLPGLTDFDYRPRELAINYTILQLPLYLRYHQALNRNWSLYVGGGPTIDLLVKQDFKYSFLEIENGSLLEFDVIQSESQSQLFLGSFGATFGIERNFSRRLSTFLETNYQHGLTNIGVENRPLTSLNFNFGLMFQLNEVGAPRSLRRKR